MNNRPLPRWLSDIRRRIAGPGSSAATQDAEDERIGPFLSEVWRLCLGRQPSPDELADMVQDLHHSRDPIGFVLHTAGSAEAKQKRADREATPLAYPLGHYYSPIVQPAYLLQSGFPDRRAQDELLGLDFDYPRMEALFRAMIGNHAIYHAERQALPHRYFSTNDMYGIGDALILSAIVRYFRPKRWIEVGSGFSSAALLDAIDQDGALDTQLTFIEPNPERLDILLQPPDRERATIIRSDIQSVPLDYFDQLAAGDVLFLDTTHISKTDSDVNHEIFQILPRLRSGVLIHFHDVFGNLEYPDAWVFDENRSWNEQYLLRAFLMYNTAFEIVFANDGFAHHRRSVVEDLCPDVLQNPGGGLWIRKR